MDQTVTSLDLPEYIVEDLISKGIICCKDLEKCMGNSNFPVSGQEWAKLSHVPETRSALDLCREESKDTITTFSKAIDANIGGGIPTKFITEFCGMPGSGRTQICLQLCVNAQIPPSFGGLGGESVYIDASNGFTAHRLSEIAEGCLARCLNAAETYNNLELKEHLKYFDLPHILSNVHYIRVLTKIELVASVKSLEEFLSKHPKVKVVIVDSISYHFKSDQDHNEKTRILLSVLSDLQRLAGKYRFAIVLTNDLTTRPGQDGSTSFVPCLGDQYYHRINQRILLERKSGCEFNAVIKKSVFCPEAKAAFKITKDGIEDV